MKKWSTAILVVLAAIASVYIFIPSKPVISSTVILDASNDAVFRVLLSDDHWQKWWPGEKKDGQLIFSDNRFTIEKQMFQAIGIDINTKSDQYNSSMILLPLKNDSTEVEWKLTTQSPMNPITRISSYIKCKNLQSDLKQLLSSFKNYVENSANVYGFPIHVGNVQDSIILVTVDSISGYPSTETIYSRIHRLKEYAAKMGAKETNLPMCHIDSVDGANRLMVGLPINRDISTRGTEMMIKRLVLGYILISEVTGGPYIISRHLRQMEQYMFDYKRRSPALPYQSLITNRLQEPDTSKWKTRISYPVY